MKNLAKVNINHDLKLVWIAPERTGSRTQANVLAYCGFENNNTPVYFTNYYHYSHFTEESLIPKDYEVICGARNPYDRVQSIYSNFFNLRDKVNFESFLFEWVEKGHCVKMIQNPNLTLFTPKYILRMENLLDDFKSLPFISTYLSEKKLKMLLLHEREREVLPPQSERVKSKIVEFCEPHFKMWGYKK